MKESSSSSSSGSSSSSSRSRSRSSSGKSSYSSSSSSSNSSSNSNSSSSSSSSSSGKGSYSRNFDGRRKNTVTLYNTSSLSGRASCTSAALSLAFCTISSTRLASNILMVSSTLGSLGSSSVKGRKENIQDER